MKNILLFIFLFVFSGFSCLASNIIIVQSNLYQADHNLKLIVVNEDISSINAQFSDSISAIQLDEVFTFDTLLNALEVGIPYKVTDTANTTYTLYFTELPIISIVASDSIVDEPRVHALFQLTEPNGTITSSDIGIEYRGSWSQGMPKKSFRIEFWDGITDSVTKDVSMLGMRSDDDWNLQAMYNEPLRFNNKTAFEIWNTIDTLAYLSSEPAAINGVRMEYVEVFVDGEYRGVYGLGERIDRKQLKLKKHNGSIRGELYKGIGWGATLFNQAPAFDNNSEIWSGFEYEHPEEEIDWTNLYDFVSFVIDAPDSVFYADYENYFSKENAINYFIFLNLSSATDNTGKNIYIGKYKANDPYFYIPWDLDGTFGTYWDGTNLNTTAGLLFNNFYVRLLKDCSPGGFLEQLQERWAMFRNDNTISVSNIMASFMQNHDYLYHNGIYEREALAWEDYEYPDSQLVYMNNWLTDRLDYMDYAFTLECEDLRPILNIAKEENIIENIELFPNPSTGILNILSDSQSQFLISNLLGQTLLQGKIQTGINQLNIQNLSPGVYFLKTEKGSLIKFVKN